MSILTFSGFEDGSTALTGDHRAAAGTGFSMDTGTVHTGTYSFRTACTTTDNALITLAKLGADGQNAGASFNVATLYTQFYFRYATKPAANDEPIFEMDNDEVTNVRINSAGRLLLYGGAAGTTLIATGTTVLSANTWYQIRFNSTQGANGAYALLINGVSELSGTANNGTTNWTNAVFGKTLNANSQTVDFFYDDIVVDDAAYPAGAAAVLGIIPTANGSTMTWTGGTGASDYQEVDEVPFNDADYVQCPTSGNPNVALFAMQNCATVGITGTILGVKATARGRENTSVTSALLVRIYSAGATSDSATLNGTTTVTPRGWIALTDPNTSSAWSTGGVDGVEMGMVENNAVADRCTQVLGMVCFIAATTSIKTIDGLVVASVKTVDGLAIASVKSINGLT